jgi:hypothetical protein
LKLSDRWDDSTSNALLCVNQLAPYFEKLPYGSAR